MTDSRAIPIHCVFYTHPWVVYRLGNQKLGDIDHALLIELAERSTLASLFDLQGRPRQGITGLLADPDRINLLGQVFEGVPAPLVLAAQPAVAPGAVAASVGLLPYVRSRYRRFVLLLNVADGEAMADALVHCDRLSFVFDLADPPCARFAQLAGTLVREGLLTSRSWGGLYWYSHPRRRRADHRERLAALREMLAETRVLLDTAPPAAVPG